jgi:histidyl-tRNA synthetase
VRCSTRPGYPVASTAAWCALDYYVRTAFEVCGREGPADVVGAGGRYDGLVAQLGGPALAGIGFAVGVDRLVLALQAAQPDAEADAQSELAPQVFVAPLGPAAEAEALAVARRLRKLGVRVELDGGRSLKSLMRRADKLAAARVLILGDEEIQSRRGTLRDMREKRDERLAVDLDGRGALSQWEGKLSTTVRQARHRARRPGRRRPSVGGTLRRADIDASSR